MGLQENDEKGGLEGSRHRENLRKYT